MYNYLEKILAQKKNEIRIKKKKFGDKIYSVVKPEKNNKPFYQRLKNINGINCIGEIKKSSPSKGLIRENFDYREIAKTYDQLNLSAISVLTEEKFFHGKPEFISGVKEISSLPVLRKDFIFDLFQVYESVFLKTDAILLICNLLSAENLRNMIELSDKLGLETLVEVHSEDEIKKAVDANAQIIGINNRNLKSFETEISVSTKLAKFIPEKCIKISESGINSAGDINLLHQAGFNAVLIGEYFMKSKNIKKAYKKLFVNGTS